MESNEILEARANRIVKDTIGNICTPANERESIDAMREYLRLVGPEICGEEIELPGAEIICRGMKDMKAHLTSIGATLDDCTQLNIQLHVIESAMIRMARESGVEIADIISDKICACLSKIRGCEMYFYKDEYLYFVQSPSIFVMNVDGNARAHCESGPYLCFADGSSLYSLNDIIVPAWIVDQKTATSAEILGIEDVDVRSAAIKKFGVAPLLDASRPIDKNDSYSLIDMRDALVGALGDDRIGGDSPMPYLVFESASTKGLIHVEGVDDNCKSVQDAIDWTAGKSWNPCIIDEKSFAGKSKSQIQQGDVLVEEVIYPLTIDAKLLDRDFVLAPENQKRHKIIGSFKLYEISETKQRLICDGPCHLLHPEHGKLNLFPDQEIWAKIEKDHTTGRVKIIID